MLPSPSKKCPRLYRKPYLNDCDYRLLSSDERISIEDLKEFDKNDPSHKDLYTDKAYKILTADKAFDLGFYEEKVLRNGQKRKVKSKAAKKTKGHHYVFQKNDGIPKVHPEPSD